MEYKKEEGQIAVVVALILVVMGVLVLSVVSRSITDIRLAALEESSSRALRAAEAGVERALKAVSIGSSLEGEFGSSSYNVTTESEGNDEYVSESDLAIGDSMEILLEGATVRPTDLDIYWGDKSDDTEMPVGAIEIIKYQKFADDDYRLVSYAYDVDASRISNNNFETASSDPGVFSGIDFAAGVSIPIENEDILLRVKAIYNSMKVAVDPQPLGTALPDQTYRVVSTGESQDGVVRKLEAVRTRSVLPPIFDSTLYSGGSLTHTE